MRYLKPIILTLTAILFLGQAHGAAEKRDSLIVSLLTAWPGSEVYELCGHSAIRIHSEAMDSTWNYGLFDYLEPNFVYRFVKGETDYMVGGFPTSLFLGEYIMKGRKVLEQDLNLTQDEAWKLLGLLRTESLPQNRVYRYNYVKDNCATRITDRLGQALGQRIIFPDAIAYGTFRDEMRYFHRDYPWYQFGIDIALGSGLDYRLKPDEEMFVPVVMSERYSGARLPDGRRLVSGERELVADSGHASLPPTPWYLTPLFVSCAALLFIVLACAWMIWKKRLARWLYTLWFLILGVAGCVVAFLVFESSHEATSPNMLILWLNPLQIILALSIWFRRAKWLTTSMCWYNIIVLGVTMIVWPFQAQSANPAFFPLMGATFLLALSYAIMIPYISYNKKNRGKHEQDSGHGTGRAGRSERSTTRTGRKAPSRGGNRR